MAEGVTFAALRDRYERDVEPGQRLPAGRPASFARALREAGWGRQDEAERAAAADVAGLLGLVVEACVSGHADVATLRRDVADLMRHAAAAAAAAARREPPAAYEPRADAFLRAYAAQKD